MRNANPAGYVSRASMIADYATWQHPAPTGPTTALPSHNVSYKRAVLVEHWDELEALLAPDQVFLERLRRAGARFYVEGEARAAHENFTRVSMLWRTNFSYGRLYAAQRVRAHRLPPAARALHGALAITVAPWRRFAHLVRALRGRGLWRELVAALPVLAPSYFFGGVGVSLGYLFGAGDSDVQLTRLDFEVDKNA
jgi:hypothetical protein